MSWNSDLYQVLENPIGPALGCIRGTVCDQVTRQIGGGYLYGHLLSRIRNRVAVQVRTRVWNVIMEQMPAQLENMLS